MSDMGKRLVVTTADTCSGSPRINGTRLTCANVVLMLTFRMSLNEFLDTYQHLGCEDVEECLRYCASRRCIKDAPDAFCEGCSLDTRPEERPVHFIDSPVKFSQYVANGEGQAFLGTEEDYENESPQECWVLAAKLISDSPDFLWCRACARPSKA